MRESEQKRKFMEEKTEKRERGESGIQVNKKIIYILA